MLRLIPASLLVFSGLIIIATGGCARSIVVTPPSLDRLESIAQPIMDAERVPFVMDTFRLSLNGAHQHPSSGLERRILNHVQETRLFSALVPLGASQVTPAEKTITARMTFEETIDPHSGPTALKGFLVGASMFLLSPLIEMDYDYSARASLELERWDGQIAHYEARSSGTVSYNLFGATPIMIDELKGRVTEACLTDLVNQIIRNSTFYVASSAPLRASPARTITVNARTPRMSGAASVVNPLSDAPTP
ncbi:MAG: hypothetical protein OEY28_05115 [Nitrospira sp.]|nr:hypothetical protein [Nitrospira sp.]